jgi:site-specific recombinase XerD
MKLSEIIPQFLSELDIQEQSRKMYKQAIEKFFLWVHANHLNPDKLGRADIINYKTHLHASKLSVASIKNYLTIVHIFYQWCSLNNIHDEITLGIKPPRYDNSYKKYPLTIKQVEDLFKAMDLTTKTGKRDKAMIRLMIWNGLRRIEIGRINIGDIDNGLIYIRGKGRIRKEESVDINDSVMDDINDYLVTRDNVSDDQPLFTNRFGNRISLDMISRIVKNYLKLIGLDSKYYTCHSLRHTTATLLLESGTPIEDIKWILRHRSINTSLLYTRLVEERRRRKYKPGDTLDGIIHID